MAIVDNHPHVDVTIRHDDVSDNSCCPAFFPIRSENGAVNILTEVDDFERTCAPLLQGVRPSKSFQGQHLQRRLESAQRDDSPSKRWLWLSPWPICWSRPRFNTTQKVAFRHNTDENAGTYHATIRPTFTAGDRITSEAFMTSQLSLCSSIIRQEGVEVLIHINAHRSGALEPGKFAIAQR